MGWETAVSAGFSLLSASNKIDQGTAQAKAIAQEGQQKDQNIADNTVRTVGGLQSSFLQSGIALGPGTNAVISQAFSKGFTDIGRTTTNANNAAKNAYNSARTSALDTIAGSALSAAGGGKAAGDWLDTQTSNLWNNGVGQTVGSWLDPSPVGPYQNPF